MPPEPAPLPEIDTPAPEPLYLPGPRGARFCMVYPASRIDADAVLVLPPFAEEMNKSRRMLALFARAAQRRGYRVVVPDLQGTGDSAGEFGEATLECWAEDLRDAADWLVAGGAGRIHLLALRAGALLAPLVDWPAAVTAGRMLLWQPVISGKTFVTQFLRLRLAGEIISGQGAPGNTAALREQLRREGSMEIAGYRCAESLLAGLERVELKDLPLARHAGVHWFEVGAAETAALSPAAQRVLAHWRSGAVPIEASSVAGDPFWATVEIAVAPALIEATLAALPEGRAA